MAKSQRTIYPSARPTAVEQILNLIREEPSWNPSSIDASTLKTLGIAPNKELITVQCLKFLGIVDADGKPTDAFGGLRENLRMTLEKQLRESYKAIFDQIPLSRINQTTLVNFFMAHGYSEDTAEYQGALFVYLCKNAAIDLPNAPSSFTRARFKKKKEQKITT